MADLTHFDESGASRMVDVGEKAVTRRFARASGMVNMLPETWKLVQAGKMAKGDVCEVARLAGIMAAKRTAEWIPLCHPLPLEAVHVRFTFPQPGAVTIETEVHVSAKTGVEMEALVAASAAALTIYDMCKAADRSITIGPIQLEEKSGGRSGHYVRHLPTDPTTD
jgi:cyclic pyranopterin phosphate synthase